jgi:MoaA/NifB/PqqE/SkfB family radical SAM enzyme
MCYYWRSLNTGINEFTLDELKKVSLSLGNFDHLLLTGGEPLLREDLINICSLFVKQNNVKRIHLPTNGLLPDKASQIVPAITEKCPNTELYVLLTLQGLEETHDEITGTKGSFQSVLETVQKLSQVKNRKFFIYMNTVVSSRNYQEVGKVGDFIKKNLAIDNHSFCIIRGTPKDKDFSPPTAGQWRELTKDKSGWESYKNHIFAEILEKRKLPFSCQAGKEIGVIEPNLDVRLCELMPVIGNLRDVNYDFEKVWFNDKAKQQRKTRNCACTHECFIVPSIIYSPWHYFESHFLWKK